MDYLKINKDAWDKRAKVHVDSKFYDVEAFKDGKSSLNTIELEQVGNVEGKKFLHLQCHFGQDTLSWARQGAKVTGVDLSTEAIEQANKLKAALQLDARLLLKIFTNLVMKTQKNLMLSLPLMVYFAGCQI